MNNEETNNRLVIDLRESIRILWLKRNLIAKNIIMGLLCGIILAFSIPKEYTTHVVFSPESTTDSNNSLGGAASLFNIGPLAMNKEGINVSLTPEIISSTPFLLEISNLTIYNNNSTIHLKDYIIKEKQPWWNYIIGVPKILISKILNLLQSEEIQNDKQHYQLNDEERTNIRRLQKAISCKIDNKTNLTTLSISLQDPLISAIVADSIINKLELYITKYKTQKAIENYNYLNKLYQDTREEYYNAQQKYAFFVNNNRNINSEFKKAEAIKLENELNIAYQVYNQISTQRQIALTKIQEQKAILTIIEPAYTPSSASYPNKFFIILGCIFLFSMFTISWILIGKDLYQDIKIIIKSNN